ncbi:hypothetical protein GCM10010358_19330 [Streptomyces minutiscleroticus]|uniref:Integral membrane protein n=1 Tax=Streptomyces minutiscleroticus TaxID=68238 RepID=A0A918KJ43_9ACTN|nr:DUF2269 family protein [Streptomyces minutiscleroticus]GGX65102.1 hypothetical protein GCM10010358_19330 [Streptomyces minutiscleroticus]
MTKFLLAVHVLAAIVAVGPVTVAASMFPPAARRALARPGNPRAAETLRLLHRICRVYATMGVVVPVFGLATANSMGVLGDTWLVVSIVLTALAAAVLVAFVLPRQTALLEAAGAGDEHEHGYGDGAGAGATSAAGTVPSPAAAGEGTAATGTPAASATAAASSATAPAAVADPRATVRLAMFTGVFNLLWAAVTVLMIVRPGSTTGA